MTPNTVRGLASVIIPCWNQLEFTRLCIAALMRQTGTNWELLVVNNGSIDGTADYLAGLQDASSVPVTVIANETNRGFPAAINQGLQYARSEYLVLLNNDVVVTDRWLEQLIALASVAVEGKHEIRNSKSERGTSESEPLESRPYPGRTITVIDLAFDRDEISGLARPPEGHPAPGSSEEDVSSQNSEPENPKSKIENPKSGIGLVGPMSNYAAPPQLVADVPYRDLEEMKAFALRWREEHRGKWFTVPKLSGFCLLIKRAVYDAIGGLDERFGLGFFDDDDLAERARRAGFELAVAHDLFVHHFGSRTFVGNGVDPNRLLDENAAKFAAKWGDSVPQGRRVGLRAWTGADGIMDGQTSGFEVEAQWPKIRAGDGSERVQAVASEREVGPLDSDVRLKPDLLQSDVRLKPDLRDSSSSARISLTMIVRDEQNNLPRCLESVRGLFDEIVVLDTGSKDRTIEIARSFGARVFDFVWVDDFAAARNAALARATGDYAFWLDADDLIEPPEREKLERLLERVRGGQPLAGPPQRGTGTGIHVRSQSPIASAFVVRCRCDPMPDGSGGDTVVDHIRLFSLIEGVRWTYRVHEQILPALKRAGVPVEWTKITVRHTGYTDRALRLRKLDRDSRILLEELAERPDDPFTLFNLGAVAIEHTKWGEALGFLNRSLANSAPSDSIVCKLFALIARAHEMQGDPQSALRVCAQGLSLDPEDGELWFRKAIVHRHLGEPAEAERCWRKILTLSRPQKFASMDQGIYGHLTRRNLAALAKERGDLEEAERQWRAVLAEFPGDRDATEKLAQYLK